MKGAGKALGRLTVATMLVALAALTSSLSHAAPPAVVASAAQIDLNALAKEAAAEESPAPHGGTVPADIARADLENLAAYVRWQRDFARESWNWHLFSTKLLMYVVLIIVAFGLLLTYLQFTRDGRPRRRTTRLAASTEAEQRESTAVKNMANEPVSQSSTLKLSPAGVEVTSQVIGLLVLGFSLAFFYLYVKNVYPMQDIELQRNAQAAGAPTGAASAAR